MRCKINIQLNEEKEGEEDEDTKDSYNQNS